MSRRCPLYPQKRTWISRAVMSALCQKQTSTSRASWLLRTYIHMRSAPIYRRAILPIHPIHFVALQISTDGNVNCRKEEGFADLGK